jgi:hypothetical protein
MVDILRNLGRLVLRLNDQGILFFLAIPLSYACGLCMGFLPDRRRRIKHTTNEFLNHVFDRPQKE